MKVRRKKVDPVVCLKITQVHIQGSKQRRGQGGQCKEYLEITVLNSPHYLVIIGEGASVSRALGYWLVLIKVLMLEKIRWITRLFPEVLVFHSLGEDWEIGNCGRSLKLTATV